MSAFRGNRKDALEFCQEFHDPDHRIAITPRLASERKERTTAKRNTLILLVFVSIFAGAT